MKKILLLCAFTSLLWLPLGAAADAPEWVANGIGIGVENYYQENCAIAEDGFGGAIIVWSDYRNTAMKLDIYAQRVDAYGHNVWTDNGVVIWSDSDNQYDPQVCMDGVGGAFIVWENGDTGSKDIYCGRIRPDGTMAWTYNVCTAINDQHTPKIIYDGIGGTIIVWSDNRNGNLDVYAQRFLINANRLWTVNGVAVCTAAEHQYTPELVADGLGGAVICWRDERYASGSAIYAQRVMHDGAMDWYSDGNIVCYPGTGSGFRNHSRPVTDGHGGAIIAYDDGRTFVDYDMYVQRINVDGFVQWTTDGVALCTESGDQIWPTIAPDGEGGAIVTWEDYRNSSVDIYANRVSYAGTAFWGTNGKAVCNSANDQVKPFITADGAGGCVITWEDGRNGNVDVFAQRFDNGGNAVWSTNGKVICSDTYDQWKPRICADARGGAYIAWNDYREATSDYLDVYAQRIEQYGNWGYPAPYFGYVTDVDDDQGGFVWIFWMKSRLDNTMFGLIDKYSVWRMLGEEQTALLLAQGRRSADLSLLRETVEGPIYIFEEASGATYGWEWLTDITATGSISYIYTAETLYDSTSASDGMHLFKIIAHYGGRFWESEPDSGYSVDNIAPSQPQGSSAEQSQNPEGLKIKWNANTEIDLDHYNIYKGSGGETQYSLKTSPQYDEILLASTEDTTYFDDTWRWYHNSYYKITAVDIHGNESPPDSIGSGDIVGIEIPDLPTASYLDQNYPNPFNPVTTIQFGLRKPAGVSLKIYNVAGQLVRVLLNEPRGPGHHKVVWDGRDGTGHNAGSGVYFYRLKADDFEQTRKMILAR